MLQGMRFSLFFVSLNIYITRRMLCFTGDLPGMLDYMIWPWFERIGAYKTVAPDKFVIPTDRYKKLVN
jgi:hypothetical protein